EALLHAEDVLDLGHGEEALEGVMGALVADGRDDALLRADDGARLVPELLHLGDDLIELLARSMGADDNDHGKRGGLPGGAGSVQYSGRGGGGGRRARIFSSIPAHPWGMLATWQILPRAASMPCPASQGRSGTRRWISASARWSRSGAARSRAISCRR